MEPPRPIKSRLYRCDRKFYTDHLRPLYETVTLEYALAVVLGERCELFYVSRDEVGERIGRVEMRLPGSTRRGGQSAQRIGRLRDEFILRYVRSSAEMIESRLRSDGVWTVRSVFVTGAKEKSEAVVNELCALGAPACSSGAFQSAREWHSTSSKDVFRKIELSDTRGNLDKIIHLLQTDPERLAFGEEIDAEPMREIFTEDPEESCGTLMTAGSLQAYGGRIGVKF